MPLKLGVFGLELLHPLELGDRHTRVLGVPLVKRGAADSVAAQQTSNIYTGFGFLEARDDLLLAEP